MQTYRMETVVLEEGVITIEGLPLHPGEKVEVIVKETSSHKTEMKPYTLRGKSIIYRSPFESVAESDWEIGM